MEFGSFQETMSAAKGNVDLRSFGRIVLRAVVSTVVIGAIALVVISIRTGSWPGREFGTVLIRNWRFGVLIFSALVIWDGWFERSRRIGMERKE